MAINCLNIKWNNHKSTFFEILKTQREKSKYTDATLAVDGKFYAVHKNIMSTGSDYFNDIFEKTSCKSPVIVLKDVPSNDIEALLDYMYLGEVDVNQNSLATFLETAKCLKIKGLGVPDEYQENLPKDTSNSHDDAGQYSRPPKRRRHDSNTLPSQVASPIPLLQNTDTAVINLELNSSKPKKSSPKLPINENSAASVNSAQTSSIPSYSTTNASKCSQEEPEEVKIEDDNTDKVSETEEITKEEHEIDSDEDTSFPEPSTSDIHEEESSAVNVGFDGGKDQESYGAGSSAGPSIKPREGPSMSASTEISNESIKVNESAVLKEKALLKVSGDNSNNDSRVEDLSREKNEDIDKGLQKRKENHTKSLMPREIGPSQDSMIQTKCMLHKCSYCDKSFLTNDKLLKHMKFHTSPSKTKSSYRCNLCHKIFSTSSVLKAHMITHTGEKAYYCSKCGIRFSRKEALLRHTRSHKSVRPYQCWMCNKTFSQNAELKSHMKTHTDEMPQIEEKLHPDKRRFKVARSEGGHFWTFSTKE